MRTTKQLPNSYKSNISTTADGLVNDLIDAFDAGIPKNVRIMVNGSDVNYLRYDAKENILHINKGFV